MLWFRGPAMIILSLVLMPGRGFEVAADPLTIYEIQSNTSDGDASNHAGEVVNCAGGIVVAKFRGFKPRVILQDPDYPDGWGGIQIKDWSPDFALYDAVQIGDDITLTNVEVDEFRGNTHLQWYTANDPGFQVISQGNPLPEPVEVSVADIPGPVYDPVEDGWFVENHDAEPYEAMRIIVRRVRVGLKAFGKAEDNYELLQESDMAWAADYMNVDAGGPYHPLIVTGAHLASIAGLFEQYKHLEDKWDYYQLCTLSDADIVPSDVVPTVSEWGVVVMGLLVLAVGTVVFRRLRGCAV